MNKELKKMSRRELVELLLEQSKAMDVMKQELDEKDKLLEERRILVSESGSIAQASLKINKVFESCQKACDQYLDNIKKMQEDEEQIKLELQQELDKIKEKKDKKEKNKNKTSKSKKKKKK